MPRINTLHNRSSILETIDWPIVIIYSLLVIIGWINIYSASLPTDAPAFLDFSQVYGKQLIFIGFCIPVIIIILSINNNFYENFAIIFYIFGILLLLGLFVFGATKKGQTNWYQIGGIGLQPSELVKVATLLFLAKYIDETQVDFSNFKSQLHAFAIIGVPVALILMQPDLGTVIIFASLIIPVYREGLPSGYLWVGFLAIICFFLALLIPVYIIIPILILGFLLHYFKTKASKRNIFVYLLLASIAVTYTLSVSYVFHNILEPHQKDRINVLLGKDVDLQKEGYNLNQSKIAIGSGGLNGKGWLEGTQTKGGFVPEQHTDYIFTTIGEEWGFIGSITVIALYVTLLLRIVILAERQHNTFTRVYGYGVASILFAHFFLNIAMLIGLFPTIGIPLPLISYGGSSLLSFTILIFIFLKLESNKIRDL